jgi:hypothetical protein
MYKKTATNTGGKPIAVLREFMVKPLSQYEEYIHTYHSRFIPEGVAEVFQIFL